MIKKKNLSAEDKKAWENFTKILQIYMIKKKIIQVQSHKERFKYDLHGFTLIDANQKVKKIILSCVKNKFKEILLITGKGLHSTTEDDTYVSKRFK